MNDEAIGNPTLIDVDVEKIIDLMVRLFKLGEYMMFPTLN